jgi:hypothetical protein
MNGQDRIITVRNDTIECKILSISSTHLNYEQTKGNRTVGKFISVSEVAEYYKDSGSQDIQHTDKPVKALRLRSESIPFRHWQAGIGFGGSYLTGSTYEAENLLVSGAGIPRNDVEEYYKKYRNGIHVNADIHYLFDIGSDIFDIGVGLKYRLSSFSSQMDVVMVTDPYIYSTLAMDEKVYINYMGASYITQLWLGQSHKFKLAYEMSAGYVHFRGEARYSGAQRNLLATGSTFGGNTGIVFTYYPFDYMSVNVDFNYFSAVLKRMKMSDGVYSETVDLERNNYENLSHLNYSFGVRFHF